MFDYCDWQHPSSALPEVWDEDEIIKKTIIVKVNSKEEEYAVAAKIHNQLKGNADYIESRIVLNMSGDRRDGTVNEVHLYIFDDAENVPEIYV